MNEREIDGILFKNMLVSGLYSLKAELEKINNLNVFPIPDGDTGDNMYSTLYGGVKMLSDGEEYILSTVAKPVGEGVLLGARGNSGVILSQFLSGITEEFSLRERADISALSRAFDRGVQKAYGSVSEPVEGTMLTVVSEPVEGTMLTVLREATAYANKNITKNSTVASYFSDFLKEGNISLENTPELLPVLKEAGVVDSGGAGVLCIVNGFLSAAKGESAGAFSELAVASSAKDIDFSLFNENSVMEFGYCTEFLLQLTHAKTDLAAFSLEKMKEEISVFGDSLVAVKTGSVVKIHIHTLTPGAVLGYAQAFGEFLTVKIENMTLQHNEAVLGYAQAFGEFLTVKIENMTLQHNETVVKKQNVFRKNLTRKRFATIAVADGEGLASVFNELGAALVIDGGQGNNPSVEIFLNAFDAVNSDVIFVLPDNGNVMLAAKEAAALYKKSEVRVIDADSMGDGYTALSALDYSLDDADEIAEAVQSDIDCSVCASVSRSIRDTSAGELKIKDGEYIGFVDKDILVAHKDKVSAAEELTKKLNAEAKNFLIAFYGRGVTREERKQFEKFIAESYPSVEFYGMDGGQEVYDFILVLQ